jgi:hypothetical protein
MISLTMFPIFFALFFRGEKCPSVAAFFVSTYPVPLAPESPPYFFDVD